MATPAPKFDPKNVQGDILIGVPKKTELFYFFHIEDQKLNDFRKQLNQVIPLVTTTAQLIETRKKLADFKQGGSDGLMKVLGVTLSFSHTGLELLGLKDKIDPAFDAGMIKDAQNLGDQGKAKPDGTFDPAWEPAFKQSKGAEIHGVISIAGDCHQTINDQLAKIESIFSVGKPNATVRKIIRLDGDVRPGKESGHEHFGFLDGVSQPFVDAGINPKPKPFKGQEEVRQGIILLGRDGDAPPQGSTRPAWTLDGSFLVFRYQPQLVPEFNAFLAANPLPFPGLSKEQGSELLGARLVGRWKSGAPIDVTPLKDDPALGADPNRNDDFHFSFPNDFETQTRCPFAAHVRKTNPRNDLQQLGISTEGRRILRRGIQFGPEVTDQEKQSGKTAKERGLLFSCFQSNIENGFQFIQHSWANEVNFPIQKPQQPGFDPLIGQAADPKSRTLSGTNKDDPAKLLKLPAQWVLNKGGEYFFTPSIPTLKAKMALAEGKTEL